MASSFAGLGITNNFLTILDYLEEDQTSSAFKGLRIFENAYDYLVDTPIMQPIIMLTAGSSLPKDLLIPSLIYHGVTLPMNLAILLMSLVGPDSYPTSVRF